MTKEQKIINIGFLGRCYTDFFRNPDSPNSLYRYLEDGWLIKHMFIDDQKEEGWVLLERVI